MLHEMKYVYAVYKEKSFTKAAQKLFISQPALSRIIKQAETEIGAPLFDRSTIPLSLTKDGEYYIKTVSQMLRMEENLKTYFDDVHDLKAGTLSVGGSSYFSLFVLPVLLGEFHARYPTVNIRLVEGNTKEMWAGLENESLDLILDASVKENDPKWNTFLYKEEEIILTVPAHFAVNNQLKQYQLKLNRVLKGNLSDMPTVPLEKLWDTPFVFLSPGNDTRARGVAMCHEAGFTPKIALEVDQLLTAANMSAAGFGATFIRPDVLNHLQFYDQLCLYRLGSSHAMRKIYFASKHGRYVSSSMRAFLLPITGNAANSSLD